MFLNNDQIQKSNCTFLFDILHKVDSNVALNCDFDFNFHSAQVDTLTL